MSTAALDKVIDRIRKLLALATSANENEAAAAALKAQALLAEYNLDMSAIREEQTEAFVIDEELHTDSRPWRRTLAANVARLYFAEYFYGYVKQPTLERACGYIRFDRHNFVGSPHNVLVAKSIFMYLCDTIERLAVVGSMTHPVSGRTSYRTSFRHACANRLSERLAERYGAVTNTLLHNDGRNLPALYESTREAVQAFMNERVGDVRAVVKSRGRIHSLEGAIDGNKAGDAIGLDVQVEQGTSTHMLSHHTGKPAV
jgi:hypothetical protein